MTQPAQYDFWERMVMSDGVAAAASVADILIANIPGAIAVERADEADDRSGTDWWVRRFSGHDLAVDCKVREEDWATKPGSQRADDLALEVWSVREDKIPGWTLRQDKRTDYILWLWKDTGRWCLVPFPMLCAVFREHGEAWCADNGYRRAVQATRRPDGTEYHSECVFVPRPVVWQAITNRYGGNPPLSV